MENNPRQLARQEETTFWKEDKQDKAGQIRENKPRFIRCLRQRSGCREHNSNNLKDNPQQRSFRPAPRFRVPCPHLQSNVPGDGCPVHGAPVTGHTLRIQENKSCLALSCFEKLFAVAFQVVPGCFPDFGRSVGGAFGPIGVSLLLLGPLVGSCFPSARVGFRPGQRARDRESTKEEVRRKK